MLRSFDYAARYALTERPPAELAGLEPLAEAWEAHNRQAFLEGYRDVPRDRRPAAGPESAPAVLSPTSSTRRSTSSTTSEPTARIGYLYRWAPSHRLRRRER